MLKRPNPWEELEEGRKLVDGGESAVMYRDRKNAGEHLSDLLESWKGGSGVILAIPNGGVLVAVPIALNLSLELRLIIVRKIQFPENPEAGFGAVGPDGTVVLDEGLLRYHRLSPKLLEEQKQKAWRSVRERMKRFGFWAQLPFLGGRDVLLVDDGLATGSTMEAAVRVACAHAPSRVVVAVPTASHRAWNRIRSVVDELVCPHVSRLPIFAVADAYEVWHDADEQEVLQALEQTRRAG